MNKLRTRKILLQIEFHFNASSLIFNSLQFDRKYQNNHRQRRDIPSGLNESDKAISFVYMLSSTIRLVLVEVLATCCRDRKQTLVEKYTM